MKQMTSTDRFDSEPLLLNTLLSTSGYACTRLPNVPLSIHYRHTHDEHATTKYLLYTSVSQHCCVDARDATHRSDFFAVFYQNWTEIMRSEDRNGFIFEIHAMNIIICTHSLWHVLYEKHISITTVCSNVDVRFKMCYINVKFEKSNTVEFVSNEP